MKKKLSQRRKINLIFYSVGTVLALAFLGLIIWIDKRFMDVPAIVVYILCPFITVGGLVLTGKIMEKTGFKEEMDRMEKEAEEEEKKSEGRNGKPEIWSIGLFAALSLIWAAVEGGGTVMDMIRDKSFIMYVPDMICSLTLLIIGLLLAGITYNVWKGRVFTEANSRIIYFIAVTLTISVLVQRHYWDSTPMIPNETVGMYFLGFGIMTAFFGSLFEIAIKIKDDQDLTI